jgi:hypothetical protein
LFSSSAAFSFDELASDDDHDDDCIWAGASAAVAASREFAGSATPTGIISTTSSSLLDVDLDMLLKLIFGANVSVQILARDGSKYDEFDFY